MAVFANRLAGVTSDGGFVVWELPEVITDDVPYVSDYFIIFSFFPPLIFFSVVAFSCVSLRPLILMTPFVL